MKLLLDQGLPRSTASILSKQGIDTIHTGDIGYATAEDGDIIEYARVEDRVIVTLDSDFHAILALSHASSPSVIRIRIERLKGDALAELLTQVIENWEEQLLAGVMLTVNSKQIRARKLPILFTNG